MEISSTRKKAGPESPIPARSRQAAIRDLIDLTEYYTASLDDDWLSKPGANLGSLPKGAQAFARATFDVRGLIQLAGSGTAEATGIDFPTAVKGIQVNFKARKLHFLQGASWSTEEDVRIGKYLLRYADGQVKSIPLVYGRNIKDWWIREGDCLLPDAQTAWTGENPAACSQGCNVRIYTYTVNNPLPDTELAAVDFVSEMAGSAPFLVALTIEPLATEYEWFDSIGIYNEIMPRSPEAGADLVDLSGYYNTSMDDDWFHHAGHDLQDVPRGVCDFAGTLFDMRGMIVLAGTQSLRVTGLALPEAVGGIRVNRKGKRLHFIQICGWDAEDGKKIGEYVIRYADGRTGCAPILYRLNVMDWWYRPETGRVTAAEEVWHGSNPCTRKFGYGTRLIKYTWDNPLPEVEIAAVDFVSCLVEAAPILVAITVEP